MQSIDKENAKPNIILSEPKVRKYFSYFLKFTDVWVIIFSSYFLVFEGI